MSLIKLKQERLLTIIDKYVDRSRCVEYTVEAGRPDTITKEKFSIFWKNLKTYISLVYEILYQIIGAPASESGQAGKRAVIPVRASQHSIDSNLESIEYLSSGQSCPLPSFSGFFLSCLLVSIPATGLLWFCFFKNFLLKFYFFA